MMTEQDYADAASALLDWLQSQEISADDAPRVLVMTLVGLIDALAKQNGGNAREGGKIIANVIMESLR